MSDAMPIKRTSRAAVALLLLVLALITPIAGPSARTASVDPALLGRRGLLNLIVQKWTGRDGAPERSVSRLGGTITRELPIVNGFAATLPATNIPALAQLAGVRALSLDRTVHVFGTSDSSALRSVYPKAVRADRMWSSGYTGSGVTVALIDTGIADVPDLAGRVLPVTDDITGRVTTCENLSGDPDCADNYGHGTFLAGIIAGSGASSDGAYKGIAPDAKLVSIKIAGANGACDVSNILAAIQWAVSFKDRYGIKVLNLSLGTDSTQTYRTDPLNYAVERAWAAGIVVVVSASNRGPGPQTISKPGDDPFVITVGATDDQTTPGLGDDTLPNFSSHGPTAADGIAKPDVVAPGGHIVSLRAPGSAVDTHFPTYVDANYRKGSGTSMSAAVVSGVSALLLQASPTMSPDRLKYALTSTAHNVASTDRMAVGSGMVDVQAALSAPPGVANVGLVRSNGMGSLDASRGTVGVQLDDPAGTVLSGLLTAQLLLWDPIVYTTGNWDGGNWYGGNWYGGNWYGANWYGGNWYGGNWYGGNWYGRPDGGNWYGGNWYGGNWYGAWEQ